MSAEGNGGGVGSLAADGGAVEILTGLAAHIAGETEGRPEVEANALRAAADAWDAGEGPGFPTSRWLRDRADHIAPKATR